MVPTSWRQVLRTNFTRWESLADFLHLTEEQRSQFIPNPRFVLNVPIRLASKMHKGSLQDPLLKQFLPMKEEALSYPGFQEDPVQDETFRKASKLLHKYQGRVLLVCTSACAMHCRYCFRQNFDYATQNKGFEEELEIISRDLSIHEVILSGGDPLSLSDEVLIDLLDALYQMPHIRRIRFHSRFPIGIPERIDSSFLNLIERSSKQIWFVLHVNHVRELDEDIFLSMDELRRRGVVILNQSVLLKGVNDNLIALKDLCETLADQGILPYYLHQLDRVQGTAHFEVAEDKGLWLIEELAKQLPGYAVPKYVREIAGEGSKTPVV